MIYSVKKFKNIIGQYNVEFREIEKTDQFLSDIDKPIAKYKNMLFLQTEIGIKAFQNNG